MAAVQWSGGKCKGAVEAKANLRHNDKDERLTHEHENADIDLAKTKDNFSYRGLSYRQKCRAYDERLASVEQGRMSSGKNARVTMQSLVVYAPKDISPDKIKPWFMDVGRIIEARYGENFIDMDVHADEVHDYIDPSTGEVVSSRVHGHAALIPVVDGKLNGKKFSDKKNIVSLNNAIHEMSIDKYGVLFMDGTMKNSPKKRRTKTVEELKTDSVYAAEQMEAQIGKYNELQEQHDALQDENTELIRKKSKLKQELQDNQDRLDDLDAREARLKAQEAVLAQERERMQREQQIALKTQSDALQRESEAEAARDDYKAKIRQVDEILAQVPRYSDARGDTMVFEAMRLKDGQYVPKPKKNEFGIIVKDANGKATLAPAKPLSEVVRDSNALHDKVARIKSEIGSASAAALPWEKNKSDDYECH